MKRTGFRPNTNTHHRASQRTHHHQEPLSDPKRKYHEKKRGVGNSTVPHKHLQIVTAPALTQKASGVRWCVLRSPRTRETFFCLEKKKRRAHRVLLAPPQPAGESILEMLQAALDCRHIVRFLFLAKLKRFRKVKEFGPFGRVRNCAAACGPTRPVHGPRAHKGSADAGSSRTPLELFVVNLSI